MQTITVQLWHIALLVLGGAGCGVWISRGVSIASGKSDNKNEQWVFRSIVPTDSGSSCPAIPVHRAHPFRSIVPSLMG
ncbi:hypothetical protein DUPY_32380 [Duganella phyllosphaerae]|uniref:Uncharacterized protein n=1 Tax=Duganella phyllosphaerae TaxID=762836 RepID=A0A1E7WH94_9BURK|nr:hypothetical protein DUPY_32380 [Duganella phyllosphaerae]